MTKLELATEIANWEEALFYHLGNYRRACENKAHNSAEQNRQEAAQAASILAALKAMMP